MARVSLKKWRIAEGLLSEDAFLERLKEYLSDGMCPALCDDDCGDVEPDGECQHGHPSVMLAAEII